MDQEGRRPDVRAYLSRLLGRDYPAFLAAQPELPCIRVNTLKYSADFMRQQLERWQIPFSRHPAHADGFVLQQDPLPLSHTIQYFLGYFVYQGVSSQLPVLALDPQPGETVLDMCAAPGTKATQIAARMKNQGRLLLNDVSVKRLQPLMANLAQTGVCQDVLLRMPGELIGRQFPEFCDRVLLDAPCSALNSFPSRLDHSWWSEAYLEKISRIQFHLLVSAIKAVKVGGTIVYSTCSICPEENEMVLQRILLEYPVQIEALPLAVQNMVRPGLREYLQHELAEELALAGRVWPFPQPYEGFFIARLRKTGALPIRPKRQNAPFTPVLTPQHAQIAALLQHLHERWGIPLEMLQQYGYLVNQNKIWLLTKEWQELPSPWLVKAGLPLAVKKSKEWKLTNASVQFFGDKVTKSLLELSEKELLALFQTWQLQDRKEKDGYYIITYEQKRLGIVSIVQGKMKMHLPHRFHLILN